MAAQINRYDVAAWLVRNGWDEVNKAGTGHRLFRHSSGVKLVLPGHGSAHLTRKIAGNIVRTIVEAGFDKALVRAELGT